MFKFFFTGFVSLFFALSALNAESLVEGKDYVTLKTPLNAPRNSVIELFNVGCPHCASMYKILPNLFAVLPKDTQFLPYHIITGAPFSKEASEVLAVALIQDKQNNLNPKDSKSYFKRTLNAYFNATFKERKQFGNAKDFIHFGLKQTNTTQENFTKLLAQTDTKALLQTWENSAQYAQIQGVPSFIINGKYLILAQNLKSEEDFIFKVDTLLQK